MAVAVKANPLFLIVDFPRSPERTKVGKGVTQSPNLSEDSSVEGIKGRLTFG